ncbi:MAG: hypothetical protein JNK43_08870 [Ignavibacteria bacterium]|nr:hypothetical protein [Ignavibacteria bacterium]
MKRLLFGATLLLAFALYVSGCSDSDVITNNDPNGPGLSGLIKVDSAYATGSKAIVALYASDSFKPATINSMLFCTIQQQVL